jgi:hypothetical protein
MVGCVQAGSASYALQVLPCIWLTARWLLHPYTPLTPQSLPVFVNLFTSFPPLASMESVPRNMHVLFLAMTCAPSHLIE